MPSLLLVWIPLRILSISMVNIVELVAVNPCLLQTLLAERGAAFTPCLYHFLDLPTVSFALKPHSLSGYCYSNYLWASTCLTLSLCTGQSFDTCVPSLFLFVIQIRLSSVSFSQRTLLVTQSKAATSYPLSHHPCYSSNTFSLFVCLSVFPWQNVSKKDDLHGSHLPFCPQAQKSA